MELPDFSQVPSWVFELPALNAILNTLSTVFIVLGWWFIRHGQQKRHIVSMITALMTSAAFLSCYLVYHYSLHRYAGGASIRFTHPGPVKMFYLAILLTHVLLAIVNLPMIICTVIPAVRQRFDKHRRIARWTLPIWLYVSVTGVVVYIMLYHLFPSAYLTQIRGR